jgi:serine/threonine-protein phosphatase 6 regulatory ankyrin repeat subunit B
MLIDRGADVNIAGIRGWTPLHRACEKGYESVVTRLIDLGADLEVTDEDGCTPLHVACAEGHESIVSMLIDRGAHLNVTDRYGWTPLHRACREGHESLATILIDAGSDLNATDGREWTPLHWACSWGGKTYLHDTLSLETIRCLILNGADTQARNSEGHLPVELLHDEDSQIRVVYEEAMVEMTYGDLKPALK